MDKVETIWFRTPKCASSSFFSTLKKQGFSFNPIGPQKTLSRHNLVKHNAVSLVMKQKGFEEAWKWIFVRNPWDRAVSSYFYVVKLSEYRGWPVPTFKDYLKTPFSDMTYLARIHSWPLYRHVFKSKNFFAIDFIGRYENLQNDFDYVCKHLGVSKCKLCHRKKGNHEHYTEYYDDECIELVANKFAVDIKRFGYTFT